MMTETMRTAPKDHEMNERWMSEGYGFGHTSAKIEELMGKAIGIQVYKSRPWFLQNDVILQENSDETEKSESDSRLTNKLDDGQGSWWNQVLGHARDCDSLNRNYSRKTCLQLCMYVLEASPIHSYEMMNILSWVIPSSQTDDSKWI